MEQYFAKAASIHFNLEGTSPELFNDASRYTAREWRHLRSNPAYHPIATVYNVPTGIAVPASIRTRPSF